jgi:hypothetical protein
LYFIFKFPNFNTRRRSGAIATYQGEGTAWACRPCRNPSGQGCTGW